MKKIILSLVVMMGCFTANAQEPEKKKESSVAPAPSRGQERAINESGVSARPESKKAKSSAKTSSTPASNENKKEEKSKDAKKPE